MTLNQVLLTLFFTGVTQFQFCSGDGSVTIPNLVRFPYSSTQPPFVGIFVAILEPLELPNYDVFFSYLIEANYGIPSNESEFSYPPLVSRSWNRQYLYNILEFKLKSHGYSPRNCLLRIICEMSLYSTEHTGILGDILHILLTPSSSVDDILQDYRKAEKYGKTRRQCRKYEKRCSVSFLNLISQIRDYIYI